MDKKDLIIKTPTEHDEGKKIHWIDGMPFTCDGGVDCQLCHKEWDNRIKNWLKSVPFPYRSFALWHSEKIPRWAIGKTIKQICDKCKKEKVPCYLCLRNKCEDWYKDPELVGQIIGCANNYDNHCKDWYCRHEPTLIETNNRWWQTGE